MIAYGIYTLIHVLYQYLSETNEIISLGNAHYFCVAEQKRGNHTYFTHLTFFFFYEYALPWQVLWFKQSWLGLHLLGCSTAHSELSCKNDRSLSAAGALPCSAILSDKNNLVQVFSNSPWGANWETGLSSKSSFRITFRSVHLQGKAHLDPLFYCILLKLFFLVT